MGSSFSTRSVNALEKAEAFLFCPELSKVILRDKAQ